MISCRIFALMPTRRGHCWKRPTSWRRRASLLRLEGGVPRSLTAREIGGLGQLPEQAKLALNPIIMIVERSFFGDRDVDAPDWKTARGSYERFAFGEGWE